MLNLRTCCRLALGADKAERIDVPEDGVIDPVGHCVPVENSALDAEAEQLDMAIAGFAAGGGRDLALHQRSLLRGIRDRPAALRRVRLIVARDLHRPIGALAA